MIKLISLSRDKNKGNKTIEATFMKDGELAPLRVSEEDKPETYRQINSLISTPGFLNIEEASEELYDLMSPVAKVENTIKNSYSLSGNLKVEDGVLKFGDFVLEDTLATHMLSLLDEDSTPKDERLWKSYIRFLDNLFQNVNGEIRSQLFRWMDYENKSGNGFGITEDGCFVGYKGCRGSVLEPTSVHFGPAIVDGEEMNGYIPNKVGSVIRMLRSDVQFDPSVGCSTGLHVGTKDYAVGWAPILTLVKVNPRDVVSVPYECDSQKLRVCEYTVMKVIDASDEHKRFHADCEYSDEEYDYERQEYDGEISGDTLSASQLRELLGQEIYVEYGDKEFEGFVVDIDETSNPGIIIKSVDEEYKHIKLHRITYWEVLAEENYYDDDCDCCYDDEEEEEDNEMTLSQAYSNQGEEIYVEYDGKRFEGTIVEVFNENNKPGVIIKNDDGDYKHIKLNRITYWEVLTDDEDDEDDEDDLSDIEKEFVQATNIFTDMIESIVSDEDFEMPF